MLNNLVWHDHVVALTHEMGLVFRQSCGWRVGVMSGCGLVRSRLLDGCKEVLVTNT